MPRPRKAGKREPNGRRQRPSQEETKMQVKSIVLEARCRHAGLRPTLDNLQAVDRQGTPWDLLHGRGVISIREAEAAGRYAILWSDMLRAVDAPRPWPKIVDLNAVRGSSGYDTPEQWARAVRDKYQRLCLTIGQISEAYLQRLVLGEHIRNAQLPDLQCALHRTADFFGLPAYRE